MNPSSQDWIPKFLNRFKKENLINTFNNESEFYHQLKTTGFLYGFSSRAILNESVSNLSLTKEEYTKVNLFHSLLYTYFTFNTTGTFEDAINNIVLFYKNLEKGKSSFFKKLTLSQSKTLQLENILSGRLQETNTLIKKDSVSLFTYALLYIDVLAFKKWLENPKTIKTYSSEFESLVVTSCFLTLKSKQKKNKYDTLLIDLFESSSDYLLDKNQQTEITALESLSYLSENDFFEKKYILDICSLAVWEDLKMDASEYQFLQQLTLLLNFNEDHLNNSLKDLEAFSEKFATKIKLFEYSSPIKLFYKQSSATVKLLILRNKNRLIKELTESGELMVLLGQSTMRELDEDEKNKVKEQLLDVCKTIPSLTIFLLPGGTILLPLLVKFIPKLLPSAFADNRIEVKKIKNK